MPTHKKPESERFKGPVKYAEYLVVRALVTVLQRVPIGLAYRLGRAVGWLAWLTMSGRRRIVRKNLEIVNAWMDGRAAVPSSRENEKNCQSPAKEPESTLDPHPSLFNSHQSSPTLPLEAQVKEVFLRNGANLFAGFTFNRMSPEQAARHIQIEGIEHLKAALSEGRGAIVLLAHMGPWEALTQLPGLARKHGIEAPFGAIYRPLNNSYLDAWYRGQREAQGTRLFSRRDGFHKPVDFLRNGGMLGILADQKLKRGEAVSFFGRRVKSSPIAGLMQRRSGAETLSVSIATGSALDWILSIRPTDLKGTATKRDRTHETEICNRALEEALSDSVLDGFWFHERF
jgi:KDO2-lipid IV(A) lauroyltransferase